MARLVKGCPTPYPQRGAGKPGTNISVTHQEEQANVTEGKDIADYNLDVDYKPEGYNHEMKQSMKKRKSLMQNMQK